MLNPDGVIFGNYRTNLAGLDLNRKWDGGDNYGLFSEVTTVRSFIAELNKERKIRFIVDLHGHSKKYLFYDLDSIVSFMVILVKIIHKQSECFLLYVRNLTLK